MLLITFPASPKNAINLRLHIGEQVIDCSANQTEVGVDIPPEGTLIALYGLDQGNSPFHIHNREFKAPYEHIPNTLNFKVTRPVIQAPIKKWERPSDRK